MTGPRRIQLRRTKGWRKPAGALVVTRPTPYGNPFRGDEVYVPTLTRVADRAHAVELFRWWLSRPADDLSMPFRREHHRLRTLLALDALRGRDLACWCPLNEPCHADVLMQLANEVR